MQPETNTQTQGKSDAPSGASILVFIHDPEELMDVFDHISRIFPNVLIGGTDEEDIAAKRVSEAKGKPMIMVCTARELAPLQPSVSEHSQVNVLVLEKNDDNGNYRCYSGIDGSVSRASDDLTTAVRKHVYNTH